MNDYRTEARQWRNRFAYACGVIILLIGGIIWFYKSNSENYSRHALDREVLIKGNEILKADLKASQDSIKAERILRAYNDSTSRKKEVLAKSEIERLKRKERGFRANPEIITLTDTIFAEYDTALVLADQRRVADSLSFEKEIKILGQSRLALETAYDSTFTQLLTVNDALIVSEKKLTRMEKIATWLGVSTATLAVVVTVLSIAL